MITDPQALESLRSSWNGVRLLREKIDRALLGGFSLGSPFALLIADAAHNLPFLAACAVLNDALAYCLGANPKTTLGTLVKNNRDTLSWVNYPLINRIVGYRNDLAHRATFVSRGDCWTYIGAIEAELVEWGIVLSVNEKAP